MSDSSDRTSFVFSDPSGRRWPRLRRILLLALALAFVGVVLFARTLFVTPQMRLPLNLRHLKGQLKSLQKANPAAAPKPVQARVPLWEKFLAARRASRKATATPPPPLVVRKAGTREVHLAFYRNGDPYSYASLEQHASQITHLCPEWMSVVNGMGDLQIDADNRLPKLTAAHGIALMPLLTNLLGDTWQPEAIENLANADSARQQHFFQNVLGALRNARAAGVVIDWQDVDPAYLDRIGDFVGHFADALHRDGRELWVCVNPGEPLALSDSDKVVEKADRFVALLYDETSEDETPGALSSRPWFEGWLDSLLADGDPDQWIIGLGSYGYDWTKGQPKADQISFAEAMSRASYAEVPGFAAGAPDYNPTFSYDDGDDEHTVSFLDATTFLNELRSARRKKAGGIAIFRLGLEDSAIWDAIPLPPNARPDARMQSELGILKGTDTIADIGDGEVVSVDESRADGLRAIGLDASGNFTATYKQFPEFPTLYHQGGGKPHEVSLTFDDGPDPKWTPKILDILKAANVKAAFFLVGVNAERYPNLVRRIVAQGHEIGNHTYYHPNLGACWPEHIRLELNATQLLLETITGRSTTLFRPPYGSDTSPSGLNELIPLKIAQDLNYLVILENIDPQDWARPGTDVIVSRVKQERRDGNIILLHDGGGDRSQTVAALPRILDYLATRGDTVVPLSTLMGTTRDAVMPLPQAGEHAMVRIVSGTGFRVLRDIEELLWAFMIVATALTVLRTLLVVWLATRFRRRANDFAEPVSVLIAAFNEGKVIAATLRSVLASDYGAGLEVVVIDDGSTDNTATEVEGFACNDERVRLLRQTNFGKAAALSRGLAAARHDIVAFLDADTHVQPDTLRHLTRPFADTRVGAVSGHAKVGNLRSFLARCQSLEYICGFNLDRRAYTRWNCVTVVPGAISAARKEAVAEAGWLSLDTLAEDTDLTLSLHRKSYRVEYAPEAIAWTEAPETVRALARQRFRWAYGTMQCLWKHRDLTFNWHYRALGWFSLPSVWLFQIILVAISPLVDFLLLVSLPFGIWGAVLPFVVIFLAIDLFIAVLACLLEGEPVIGAWRILPMRLIYRPLLSYVIWKASFRALKGVWVSWAKIERTASVPART
ncbi:MAG TPA: glycosyltransferase [Chthoniobacterales bacterium]|jgi:cellulose synthase/poly-beta-1,6-N-acetylglucosamine synthase-like glycosyltransferase/peptidoglycan/xylan/chitin deacetylase (PgdA/CDA1 family)/spore germination protein YaaH